MGTTKLYRSALFALFLNMEARLDKDRKYIDCFKNFANKNKEMITYFKERTRISEQTSQKS